MLIRIPQVRDCGRTGRRDQRLASSLKVTSDEPGRSVPVVRVNANLAFIAVVDVMAHFTPHLSLP
jgi:hypothetical protein